MKKTKYFLRTLFVSVMALLVATGVSAAVITGSGTAGKMTKFVNTASISDSLFADDGTNVSLSTGKLGIGTTTPLFPVHVNGEVVAKGPFFDVRAYGAKGDGATDDTSAINAAISAVASGGVVLFPAGNYLVTSTINLTKSSITLQGAGSFGTADVGSTFSGTRITWANATGSPLISASAPTGASNQALKRISISDMSLDCAGYATIGLEVKSVHFGSFRNLYLKNCTTAAIDMNVVSTLGEARDNSKNLFQNISIRQIDGSGAGGIGIRLDGDSTANTSNNDFMGIAISHYNGVAIKSLNTDTNRFYGVTINRVVDGTGIGVELAGTNSASTRSRSNVFYFLSAGAGGLTSRGTGFSHPADRNWVFFYSQENGEPTPTIETGSVLYYHTDQSYNRLALVDGGNIDSYTASGSLLIAPTKAGTVTIGRTSAPVTIPSLTVGKMSTSSNCNSSASPAVCGSASAGSVAMATGGSTLTVNTTAVTANSQIFVFEDSSLGTRLGITCNTTTGRDYTITARTAGTSFQIKSSANPTTNKACLSYFIVN